jgi:hypothetical protein
MAVVSIERKASMKTTLQSSIPFAIAMLGTLLISQASHAQSWAPPSEDPKPHSSARTSPKSEFKKRGFQSAVFLGSQKYVGSAGSDFDLGVRLGGSVGFRLTEMLSIQGELTFDFENPSNSTSTPTSVGISLVPMFHFALGSSEFRMAPKAGIWSESASSEVGGNKIKQTSKGTLLGANFALVYRVGDYELGPMLMLEEVSLDKTCLEAPSFGETCRYAGEISINNGNTSVGVASLNFVLWF